MQMVLIITTFVLLDLQYLQAFYSLYAEMCYSTIKINMKFTIHNTAMCNV